MYCVIELPAPRREHGNLVLSSDVKRRERSRQDSTDKKKAKVTGNSKADMYMNGVRLEEVRSLKEQKSHLLLKWQLHCKFRNPDRDYSSDNDLAGQDLAQPVPQVYYRVQSV